MSNKQSDVKRKPSDAQCTNCSVDEPYHRTVWLGGVICGGCGRRKANVKYVLVDDASATITTNKQSEDESKRAFEEHYAAATGVRIRDSQAATWDAAVAFGEKRERERLTVKIEDARQALSVSDSESRQVISGKTNSDNLSFERQRFNIIIRNICREIERRVRGEDGK